MRFSNDLISWYLKNKRDLPWRRTKDPYLIWLSEIILQQTRVEQGLSYYEKFKNEYPTINDLAKANENEVLKLWQGLGYYSRARNLHYTAKYISNEFNGSFPNDYKKILSLKGVGEYTAAAISSFSFGKAYPVIDGNVYRVLSRVFGVSEPIDSTIGKKKFKELANSLIDQNNPDIYNQAIMEFGALQCLPKKPACDSCIFKLNCFALKNDLINVLPSKKKKINQRARFFNYIIYIDENENTYLKQRKENDIWKGLFDFPLIETVEQIEEISNIINLKKNEVLVNKSNQVKHILSHQKIYATFWKVKIIGEKNDSLLLKTQIEDISKFAVPKLLENYIKKYL